MSDDRNDSVRQEQLAAIDRAELYAKSPHTTPEEHDNIMVSIELARSSLASTGNVWPEKLTPVLRAVLGIMCFELGGYAHVYQRAGEFVDDAGTPLNKRAEDEQAFMLHKLVGYALEHGRGWGRVAQADLARAKGLASAASDRAVA